MGEFYIRKGEFEVQWGEYCVNSIISNQKEIIYLWYKLNFDDPFRFLVQFFNIFLYTQAFLVKVFVRCQ